MTMVVNMLCVFVPWSVRKVQNIINTVVVCYFHCCFQSHKSAHSDEAIRSS